MIAPNSTRNLGSFVVAKASATKRVTPWRRALDECAIVCLFALITTAMLAPIGSSEAIPTEHDFKAHTFAIRQAALALGEGQFPPRVAPQMNGGLRYPYFQFYSPLPYTIAGALHRWVMPNPFSAYRAVLWLALVTGGVFVFKLARWLTRSTSASLLAAVAYLAAPYILVNICARSAWTEAIAQGILPTVLYTSFALRERRTTLTLVGSTVAWLALLLTHTITFVYLLMFVALLFALLSVRSSAAQRNGVLWQGAVLLGVGLLAWYFLEPMVTVKVSVKELGNPYASRSLAPLHELISPVSIPPEPQPGAISANSPGLHPAVGWPLLLGACSALYALFRGQILIHQRWLVGSLGALLALAFFITWSPIDFWQYLPQSAYVVQFTYRNLTHVIWTAALLFAFGIKTAFPKPETHPGMVLVGLLLLGMSGGSWAAVPSLPPIRIEKMIEMTDFVQPVGYQMRTEAVDTTELAVGAIPFNKSGLKCQTQNARLICEANPEQRSLLMLPNYYYPDLLRVSLNDVAVPYAPAELNHELLTAVTVDPGPTRISVAFRGSRRANLISVGAWIALPALILARWLSARVRRGLSSLQNVAPGTPHQSTP